MPDSAKIMRFYSIFCRVSCQTQNFNNIFSEKNVFSRRIEPQFRSQKRQIWFKSLPPPQKRDWHLLVPSIFGFSKKREKRRKTKKTRENPGFFVGHLFWSQNLVAEMGFEPHDLRVMRTCIYCIKLHLLYSIIIYKIYNQLAFFSTPNYSHSAENHTHS